MYQFAHACALNTEHIAEKKEMTEEMKRITEELLPIQEELGGIPKSLISDALEETGLAEDAQDWLSQQGQ